MNAIRVVIAVIVLLSSSGCAPYPTLRSYRKSGLGRPISAKKALIERKGSHASSIGWKETTYNLPNGNWVYVEPDSPNCFIHWEVNPDGIIVGSHTEGKGCEVWPW